MTSTRVSNAASEILKPFSVLEELLLTGNLKDHFKSFNKNWCDFCQFFII